MRVKMGDDVFEELVAYNEVLEFIEDDYHVDDDIYEVVKICDHFMPQVPTATGRHKDPVIPQGQDGKDRAKFIHQGSRYNVLVQWANKEWKPRRYTKYQIETHSFIIIFAPVSIESAYIYQSTPATNTQLNNHYKFYSLSSYNLAQGTLNTTQPVDLYTHN